MMTDPSSSTCCIIQLVKGKLVPLKGVRETVVPVSQASVSSRGESPGGAKPYKSMHTKDTISCQPRSERLIPGHSGGLCLLLPWFAF